MIRRSSATILTAVTLLGLAVGLAFRPACAQASVILRVDYSDFLDSNPLTNSIRFTGVSGAFPAVTVTDNGNFPQLDLRNFFASNHTGTGVTSATTEGLADFLGRTYGRLFLSGTFSCPPFSPPPCNTDIPLTSLGLLATNLQHHDFDVNHTALVGQSVFDCTGLGFTAADFGTGGDLYAQDFPWAKIGQWEAVLPSPPAVILRVDYSDFLDGNPLTNSIRFTGVSGAFPAVTVTDNGNFPQLDLRNFFASNHTGTGVTSATTEGLADFLGRTYGRLFLSGTFSCPPFSPPPCNTDIPLTSLGLLATNLQHHDFDVNHTALVGQSVFDCTGLGLTAADFGTGGDVYAQDFPWAKIGRWEAVLPSPPAVILRVDYSDFLDSNPLTNSIRFTGVSSALPAVTVTDNGNFPQLDLRNFFASNHTGTGVTSATTEGLADFLGRTYGRLFLSGTFSCPPFSPPPCNTDIPLTSLGLLATNLQHHDFDVNHTALVGQSVFDCTGLGFTAADFGTGGDVYAQDFPWAKIGRWESGSTVPVMATTWGTVKSLYR